MNTIRMSVMSDLSSEGNSAPTITVRRTSWGWKPQHGELGRGEGSDDKMSVTFS